MRNQEPKPFELITGLMSGERILIVEDERAVARGLEHGLKREGYSVLWADTGKKALDAIRQNSPHLIILDIRLPDASGFDLCRQIRAEGRRQPVIMLTARDEHVDRVLGLELGADDYVVKPYNLSELVSRVRAQLRRAYGELAHQSGNKFLAYGPLEMDLEYMRVTKGGQAVELTATEFRLLACLAGSPGRPFSREALIEKVWGCSSEVLYDRTVDAHIRHLRQKLEDDPENPRWLVTVRGVGYKFEDCR